MAEGDQIQDSADGPTAHFLAIAARCVRQVLISHARGRRSAQRGGGKMRLSSHDGIFDYGGAAD